MANTDNQIDLVCKSIFRISDEDLVLIDDQPTDHDKYEYIADKLFPSSLYREAMMCGWVQKIGNILGFSSYAHHVDHFNDMVIKYNLAVVLKELSQLRPCHLLARQLLYALFTGVIRSDQIRTISPDDLKKRTLKGVDGVGVLVILHELPPKKLYPLVNICMTLYQTRDDSLQRCERFGEKLENVIYMWLEENADSLVKSASKR